MSEQNNIHKSHRERIRDKAMLGFLPFADHEILEMMLFYSIPRGDTNELGHQLIERFGSFNAVLEASVDELQQVKGIGLSSALQIKLVAEMVRRYVAGIVETTPRYDTLSKVAEYIWPRFAGLAEENLYVMLFDNRMAMIDCVRVAEGSVNSASVPLGRLLKMAYDKNASAVILAHNHPHGIALPSDVDSELTAGLAERLSSFDITLIEHLIIAEDRYYPIVKNKCRVPGTGNVYNRSYLVSQGLTLDDFYDIDEETYRFERFFESAEHNLSRDQ